MSANLSTSSRDSLLITAYVNGNESALSFLIHKYQQRLYNFIYSKVFDRETSEDLFQDTFIKVIHTLKRGDYNEEGKFLSWVMRIAHNLVIDHFRKNQRVPKFENKEDFDIFQFIADGSPNVENTMVNTQISDDIKNLVASLPEDQKEVLTMRLYRDMSFKEIAESTDVSINTALGRMRYAIINLRKLIEENNIVLTS